MPYLKINVSRETFHGIFNFFAPGQAFSPPVCHLINVLRYDYYLEIHFPKLDVCKGAGVALLHDLYPSFLFSLVVVFLYNYVYDF